MCVGLYVGNLLVGLKSILCTSESVVFFFCCFFLSIPHWCLYSSEQQYFFFLLFGHKVLFFVC